MIFSKIPPSVLAPGPRSGARAVARADARICHGFKALLTQFASSEPCDDLVRKELRGIFDEELGHLPEKFCAPVVLCYLEGMTCEEAARQRGWTKELFRLDLRGRESFCENGWCAAV